MKPYPTKQRGMTTLASIKPELVPAHLRDARFPHQQIWYEIDMKTGDIVIDLRLPGVILREALSAPEQSKFRQWVWTNVTVPLRKLTWNWPGFRRRANVRTLYTEMNERIALMAILKPKSRDYEVADAERRLLHAIIESKDYKQPTFLWTNVGMHNPLETFLWNVGRQDEARALSDVWMKSDFTDKARAASRKAHKDKLKQLVILRMS